MAPDEGAPNRERSWPAVQQVARGLWTPSPDVDGVGHTRAVDSPTAEPAVTPAVTPALPPDVVLVPSLRVQPGDEQAQLVLRQVDDDLLVLPAYSSIDELVRCCGPDQPWVALPADTADEVAAQAGAATVLLDTVFTDPEPEAGA